MTAEDNSGKETDDVAGARPNEGVPPVATRRHKHLHGSVLFLYAFLLIAGAAGYYWVTQKHAPAFDELQRRVDAIGGDAAQLNTRFEQAEQESRTMAAARQAMTVDLGALKEAQLALEDSVKALYAKDKDVSLAWVLAEAEYLILAATQRLALERDVRTAIAALQAADTRLRTGEHPDLIGVREQLAKDIASLQAVNLPDIEGLAIYLAETVARADELPTKPIADIDMSFNQMRDEDMTPENWRSIAKAVWADVRGLVEIKDGELPDGVLFDPELRYFLQQNLRLELASARLSVLRRDNANFRAASKLIVDLLNEYYDLDDAGVAAIVTRLNKERNLDLDPAVPDIAASLDAVRARRLSLHATAGGGLAERN